MHQNHIVNRDPGAGKMWLTPSDSRHDLDMSIEYHFCCHLWDLFRVLRAIRKMRRQRDYTTNLRAMHARPPHTCTAAGRALLPFDVSNTERQKCCPNSQRQTPIDKGLGRNQGKHHVEMRPRQDKITQAHADWRFVFVRRVEKKGRFRIKTHQNDGMRGVLPPIG